MSRSGYERTPNVIPGAFVQLVEQVIGFIPNIVAFQYNPASISRTLEPWNPFEVDQANRGAQAPTVQPYEPQEKFSFSLELNASDGMEEGNPLAVVHGVAPQIAALKKLTQPSKGLLGDLVASASAVAGRDPGATERASVPVVLMILGPGIIYPVRITSFGVEQKEFNTLLYPIQATVQIEVAVLTPDTFKCSENPAASTAMATYNFTKHQEDMLATLNLANSAQTIVGNLPF
ncbi:MAG: hypothetical protein ACSHWS_07700 [Sulfitobacter sp.]